MRKLSFLLIFVLALVVSLPSYAQENTTPTTNPPFRNVIKDRIGIRKENIQERIETRKEMIQEKMEARKIRIATKSAALKEKITAFRDQAKAKRVENINTNLDKLNTKMTDEMTKHLDKMSEILAKLEERVNNAATSGKDTASASAAIATAHAAIDAAESAVTTQAGKEYTVTISSETNAKLDSQAVRDNMHKDLKAVHELIKIARKAVADAIQTTATTLGGIKNGQ